MNKLFVTVTSAVVIMGAAGIVRAADNSCNQEKKLARWGCETHQTVDRAKDYVHERAPVWRGQVQEAITKTRDAIGDFARGYQEGGRR